MQRLEKLRRGLREAAEPLPEQLTPINKLVLKDKIKKKAIKRARRILNSHENDPLSIMLAASNPTVVFLRDTPIETADADKSIANARAKNGFKLLAQEAQKPDFEERLEKVDPFEDIESRTFLNELPPGLKRHLSLIRLVTGCLDNITIDDTVASSSSAMQESKLEVFAAVVGFAQVNIIDSTVEDKQKYMQRDAILRYGIQALKLAGEDEVIAHIYKSVTEDLNKTDKAIA